MKFKDKTSAELLTLEEAEKLPEYSGVLSDDTILLDFDSAEDAEIASKIVAGMNLQCRMLKSTRGVHILMRRGNADHCLTGTFLTCGIVADVKVGCKSSYETLKKDGVQREVIRECIEPQIVPPYFMPFEKSIDKRDVLAGNRNSALFAYCAVLIHGGFGPEAVKSIIEVINDYVLDNPLSQQEIQSITREESLVKIAPNFIDKNVFRHDKFAEYMINNCHVIKLSGVLHIYKDGIYSSDPRDIEYKMIEIMPTLNKTKRDEVMDYLNISIRKNSESAPPNYIAFSNGVYNLETKQISKLSPEIILTNQIPHDVPVNTSPNLVDDTLMKIACGNKNIFNLLCEASGYCLFRRNELGKAFFFIGGHNNGKSTYIDMVLTMLGRNNVSTLDVANFSKPFYCAKLLNMLANLGDDIDSSFIPNTSIFRKLVTGDSLTVDNKYELPFTLTNYAKMLFSANKMPAMKEVGGEMQRRIIPIPFKAKFTDADPDFKPYIKYDLQKPECMSRFIELSLMGLQRVLATNKFTLDKSVKSMMEKIARNNNPVLGFVDDVTLEAVVNHTVKSVYENYKFWAMDYGFDHPVSCPTFEESICANYDLTTIRQTVMVKNKAVKELVFKNREVKQR